MSLAAQLRVLSGHGTSSSSRTKGLPSSIAGIGGTGSGTLITPSFLFSSRQAADTDTSSIHLLSLSASIIISQTLIRAIFCVRHRQ